MIESNDHRYTVRDEYQKEALRVALESNDRRLNAMNEFRSALADQGARMITREESEIVRRAIVDKADETAKVMNARLEAELRPVHTKLNEIGRPNWALLASLISIAFVMIAGIWLVIGLKIDSSLLPVSVAVENIKVANATVAETVRNTAVASSASTQADILSRDDRSQANGRLQTVEQLVSSGNADRRAADARTAAQLIEVETQFKSASVVINIHKDETQQLLAVLWQKVFPGTTLPPADYRPNLYRENQAQ
jgi:hypothetical protein